MIEIAGLTKRFGRHEVLRGVDLEICRGRITAIVGPNAAGKTTLIKTILGLVRPDGGILSFDGAPINGDPGYRSRVGYMPQTPRFPENLRGVDLLDLLMNLRRDRSVATDRELVDHFALEPELEKQLRALSGGTRQKVNAVAAFLFDPELLILDEPTAGLDPVSSGILKRKILSARSAGKTVIITSHVMSELEQLAEDVAFLSDGRIRFAGALRDLKIRTREASLEAAIARMMSTLEAA
jgi:Cu-processing system ATP-binding protein